MVKAPHAVSGFIALPVALPATRVLPSSSTHYLYLKPHDPKVPDEDTPRSLFCVNIPIATTAAALKNFLTTILDGGHIERVYFSEDIPKKPSVQNENPRSRKRKRQRPRKTSRWH